MHVYMLVRFSESYFTIKGAALILPKSNKLPHTKKRTKSKSSLPGIFHSNIFITHKVGVVNDIQHGDRSGRITLVHHLV